MSEQCANCANEAPFGKLCAACEGVWMRERRNVVDEAEHLTDLAVKFQAWCAAHNQPNPYD